MSSTIAGFCTFYFYIHRVYFFFSHHHIEATYAPIHTHTHYRARCAPSRDSILFELHYYHVSVIVSENNVLIFIIRRSQRIQKFTLNVKVSVGVVKSICEVSIRFCRLVWRRTFEPFAHFTHLFL